MYSPEGSSTRMNYYVPLNDAVESSPLRKGCAEVSTTRRAIRILGRRYALTATGYKYLEIGINVGPPSYVEIVIGDHRGKELILTRETWKRLYDQRWNIQTYLWSPRADTASSISAGPLMMRFGIMNNTKLVYLESSNARLAMTVPTLFSMFDLDSCIDVMFNYLHALVEKVDEKFERFSHIASTVTKDVSEAIFSNDYFDKNQLIDCELLALVFSKKI